MKLWLLRVMELSARPISIAKTFRVCNTGRNWWRQTPTLFHCREITTAWAISFCSQSEHPLRFQGGAQTSESRNKFKFFAPLDDCYSSRYCGLVVALQFRGRKPITVFIISFFFMKKHSSPAQMLFVLHTRPR